MWCLGDIQGKDLRSHCVVGSELETGLRKWSLKLLDRVRSGRSWEEVFTLWIVLGTGEAGGGAALVVVGASRGGGLD